MKNSFIKILLIITISLNIFQQTCSDEFNFDVTEIQIYNKGNLIKGIGGGTVTSNNIIITADNFEYNKLTLLLKANGNVKLIDTEQDIIIESQEIFYQKDKEKIYTKGKSKATNLTNIEMYADEYFKYSKLTSLLEAKGDVIINDNEKDITIETNNFFYLKNKEKFFTKGKTKIFIQKEYIVDTKDLVFLRNQDLLSSKQNTLLDHLKLNNIYKLIDFEYSVNEEILKGNKINITTKNQSKDSDEYFFETGFFNLKENKFLAKDVNVKLHKSLFGNNKNDPRINAVSGYGDELSTYFEKGVFTSCKKNDNCPPWKITSDKIKHDKVKKQVIYTDAWLEIYDFPVVYFPKFFHPDPTVKRQSGFLRPELGSSENLGSSIYTPYFFVISDEKDLTVKPRLFDSGRFVFQNEYKQKTKNSYTMVDFSLAKGHDSNLNDRGDTRSHFFTNSKINLNLDKFSKSLLEINYEKTSNDNYLKLFNLESPLIPKGGKEVLESEIKLDLEHQDYDLTTSFEMYETLNGSNSDRYVFVLPSYNFSKNFILGGLDSGSFNFNSYGSNTLDDTNTTASILSNDLDYNSYDSFFDNGIKTNYSISLKNTNSVGKNSKKYKTSPQSELSSIYVFNASYPLKKITEKNFNTFEPVLSLRFNPHDMKNNKDVERRIGINNIYNIDRLSLGDSLESGESMTIGFNFKKEKIGRKDKIVEIEDYLDFRLATTFRLNEEKNIPLNSTLGQKSSNIFGQLDYKPTKHFSLNYDFSIDNNLSALNYNSVNAQINLQQFTTGFTYIKEKNNINKTDIVENNTKYNFNEQNSLSFKTRRNRKINLTEYYDLIYEYQNDCLVAGMQYKKKYYNDADIKPVEELFFSITIIPFATFSPDKMALN